MLLATVGLLISWLPILLANLPGFFNYDISGQLIQVMYADLNTYNTHHSLLSTIVMGGIITLGYRIFGTLFAGILLYSCFQMILCAVTFAYSLCFIYKKTGRIALVAVGFLFYAFSPTIAMFTMSTTKDVICTLCLLLASMMVFEMLEAPKQFFSKSEGPIVLAAFLVLASLYRKNIIYAVVLFAVLSLIFGASERKNKVILFVATIVASFVVSFVLEKGLDAEKGGAAEAYSIPIQQIGYLYTSVGETAFTENEQNFLYNIASKERWEQYNPFISDNIKNYISAEFAEHKGEFLSLWIKKGLQFPGAYIKGFLNLTYQAWYPGTSIYEGKIYYFDFYGFNYRIEKTSYIPKLTELCEKISLGFCYQKVPVVRLFFSLGFMFRILLITIFRGIYTRQSMIWGMGLLALCVCLTCMAGPVSLVRYYLILFFAFPVYLSLFFYKSDCLE